MATTAHAVSSLASLKPHGPHPEMTQVLKGVCEGRISLPVKSSRSFFFSKSNGNSDVE